MNKRNGNQDIAELRETVQESVRQHPLPYAITGLGIACSVGHAIKTALRKPEPPPTFRKRCTTAAEQVAQAARDKAHAASDVLAEKSGAVKHKLADVTSTLKSAGAKTETSARNVFREHPILVGSGVIATGLVAGVLLPSKRN